MQAPKVREFIIASKALLRDTSELVVRNVMDFYAASRAEGNSPLKAAAHAAIPALVQLTPAVGGAFLGAPKVGIASSVAFGVVMAMLMPDTPSGAFPRTANALRATHTPAG